MSARNKYFSYQASGSAFGGVITKPSPLTVPTQAMASLSPALAGYGTSTVENFGIEDLLSVRRATTTVQGDPHQTEVTITIEDVDLMGVLYVGRIVMHLTCRPNPGAYESSITPAGSMIEGLKVRGTYVNLINKANVFDRHPSYSDLQRAYIAGDLRGLILNPTSLDNYACKGKVLADCVSRAGDIKATLFPLEDLDCGLPVEYGGLRVKSFGTLYLGEYRITNYARKLTMLRVELGCDREGGMGFGGGIGNGHEEPPS